MSSPAQSPAVHRTRREAPAPELGQPFNPRRYRAHGLTPADIILMQPDLKPGSKTIYACLWALTEPETGLCAIGYEALSQKANIKRSQFFLDLGVLKTRNLLLIERNGPHVNTFRFIYQDVFDVQRAGCLLKDVQRAGHQEKRCPAGRMSFNSVQTQNQSVQNSASLYNKTEVVLSVVEVGRYSAGNGHQNGNGTYLPTPPPERETYEALKAYLCGFVGQIHRPPTEVEVLRVLEALGAAPVAQLAARVQMRQRSGLEITGYGIFVGIAEECAQSEGSWSAAAVAGVGPKPTKQSRLGAIFEQIEREGIE